MNEMKSAFCWASISRLPPVKKSTASKSFKFFALYSSFFLVRASESVRRVVSQSPVSLPNRSIVAIAWDTASWRYPFSSPMTRRCFVAGAAVDCAAHNSQRLMLTTANAIQLLFFIFYGSLLFLGSPGKKSEGAKDRARESKASSQVHFSRH